jgi:Zn-finger nucleic acid-binding protein
VATRLLRCPRCGAGTFHTLAAVGVEVDLCATCGGAFLDAPEINSFLKRGRSTRSPMSVAVDSIDVVSGVSDVIEKIIDAVV